MVISVATACSGVRLQSTFHAAIGMHPDDYDFKVLRLTTEISRQVFPITLDLDHPRFKPGLDRLVEIERKIAEAKKQKGIVARLKQATLAVAAAATFARLYVLPAKCNALPAQIRLAPVW
ncbi:hypothetical protein [Methylocystis sp.]|uniref:hypothetical protein n=1 Tax=Methylocystis sp. TaxID=1911079 RepID=UPI0025DB8EB2|nr:hypothetical protein [Methylocystis sp.]